MNENIFDVCDNVTYQNKYLNILKDATQLI